MLTRLRGLLQYHVLAATQSLISLLRQPMATAMTLLVMAITLTLPLLLWIVTDNMSALTQQWKEEGYISLYLDMQVNTRDATLLLQKVKTMSGVGQAVLKSPADALLELEQQEGMHDLLENLPDNPLPSVIEVIPQAAIMTPSALQGLYSQLKALPEVQDAQLDMQWVKRLYALLAVLTRLTHGLMLLLSVAVVLIVGNTLRLVIQQRHEEIMVLKLIGARDTYIIRPFLYSGFWYGLMSSVLALIFVFSLMLSLKWELEQLFAAYQMKASILGISLRQAFLLLGAASFLGWLGARFSVKRQLALIEP